MSAVEKRFDLVRRYYRLKRKLLGYDKLYDYDRYAPIFGDLPGCDWPTGRDIVQESYDALSPEAGKIIRHSSRRTGSTPSCALASAAERFHRVRFRAFIPTS